MGLREVYDRPRIWEEQGREIVDVRAGHINAESRR
jgi:hypothetical protein